MKSELTLVEKIFLLTGSFTIAAAVYLGVKYLFPITAPFVIAYLVAMLIEKPVKWLARRLGGRNGLAAIIIVVLMFVVLGGALGYVIWLGIKEIRELIQNYNYYVIYVQQSAAGICSNIDCWLGIADGSSFALVSDVAGQIVASLSDGVGGQLVGKVVSISLPMVINVVKLVGSFIVGVMSVIYLCGSMDKIRAWCRHNVFRREIKIVGDSLGQLIHIYFKVQAVIIVINALLCVIGLMIIGNPYAVVIGVLIGLIDALPIFGAGTVLLPWCVFELISGNFFPAAVLVTLYVLTYFVREIMESRCMGTRLGIAPFTMLVVIFVGLMVYGIMGFILGPVSYCIIKPLILYLKRIIERGKLKNIRKYYE